MLLKNTNMLLILQIHPLHIYVHPAETAQITQYIDSHAQHAASGAERPRGVILISFSIIFVTF